MRRQLQLSVIGTLGVLLGAILAASGAFASVEAVSPGSAIREIQANIDDWQNEQAKAQPEYLSACRDAGLERLVWPDGLVPSPPIDLPRMPHLFVPPFSPEYVSGFVSDAFEGVQLVGTEETMLSNLQNREIRSDADALQLAIDAQTLAISVSNRIYSAAIQMYYQRALIEDSSSELFGKEDICHEDDLRLQRDYAMIEASRVLIQLYGQVSSPQLPRLN